MTVSRIGPSSMPSTAQTGQLFRLPPELRNRVYELCFIQVAREVNIIEAQPPPKDLLCACRQVYNEARLMHRQAYRDYWSKTCFVLHLRTGELDESIRVARGVIASLGAADIRHISLIRIENTIGLNGYQVWIFRDGLWHYWDTGGTDKMGLTYVELWVSEHDEPVFHEMGYEVHEVTDMRWRSVQLRDVGKERIEEAKSTAGKQGLSKEELLLALDED